MGFVLLPSLGTWRSLMLLAALYPLMLAGLALRRASWPRLGLGAIAVGAAIALARLNLDVVQDVTFGVRGNERLVEVQEGTHATVTVVDTGSGRAIRVNSHYTLGSSRNLHLEQNQTVVPLLTHPNPRSMFYLGMGTGNLYTLEHYRMGLDRLKVSGLYVQWVPLYQVSEREFAIIARTMAAVFPQVVARRSGAKPLDCGTGGAKAACSPRPDSGGALGASPT
jgi:hypothetical protein